MLCIALTSGPVVNVTSIAEKSNNIQKNQSVFISKSGAVNLKNAENTVKIVRHVIPRGFACCCVGGAGIDLPQGNALLDGNGGLPSAVA